MNSKGIPQAPGWWIHCLLRRSGIFLWSGRIWDVSIAGCKWDRVLENEISVLSQMIRIKTSQLKHGSPLCTDISPKYSVHWQPVLSLTGAALMSSVCKLYLNTHLAYMQSRWRRISPAK